MPKQVDDLTNDILAFVDRHGRVLEKSGTPMNAHLRMRYEGNGLKAEIYAYCHAIGNGSCQVEVKSSGKTVFKAHGSFMTKAFGVSAATYVPGPWTETFSHPPKVASRRRARANRR